MGERPGGAAARTTAPPPALRTSHASRPHVPHASCPPRARHALLTPLLPLALVLALASAALLAGAAPAHATGYRYWSFWQAGDRDGWTYARTNPGVSRPSDGDVEGWRFAVSEDGASTAAKPRRAPDFAAVCGDTPARDGRKRIALVIDFGTAEDAPGGERPPAPGVRTQCAAAPRDATSSDVLASAAEPLRYDSSALLCAIAGYPRSGCGETVAKGSGGTPGSRDADREPDRNADRDTRAGNGSDSGPSLGLVAGGAAVAVLGAAAVWQARRRRP